MSACRNAFSCCHVIGRLESCIKQLNRCGKWVYTVSSAGSTINSRQPQFGAIGGRETFWGCFFFMWLHQNAACTPCCCVCGGDAKYEGLIPLLKERHQTQTLISIWISRVFELQCLLTKSEIRNNLFQHEGEGYNIFRWGVCVSPASNFIVRAVLLTRCSVSPKLTSFLFFLWKGVKPPAQRLSSLACFCGEKYMTIFTVVVHCKETCNKCSHWVIQPKAIGIFPK